MCTLFLRTTKCIAIVFALILLSTSCSRNDDDDFGGKRLVYFELYGVTSNFSNPSLDTIENLRICYDLDKKMVIWSKTNEYLASPGFRTASSTLSYFSYSHAFKADDGFIKIFPAVANHNFSSPSTGIYFQKIDKLTGDATVSRMIISPGEYSTTDKYSISEVVSDGSRFYFACNNGFVYCFDSGGNLVSLPAS